MQKSRTFFSKFLPFDGTEIDSDGIKTDTNGINSDSPDKKANKDKKVIFYHNYTIYDYAIADGKDTSKVS